MWHSQDRQQKRHSTRKCPFREKARKHRYVMLGALIVVERSNLVNGTHYFANAKIIGV